MNKLLYISTGIPREEADRLRQKQFDFSSNALLPITVFHGNILTGLAEQYDEVCALSGVPINHKNFRILRYSGRKLRNGKIQYVIPGFFNLPGVKQLTVTVKLWAYIRRWCRKNRGHNCHILLDGTFYTGLLALAAGKTGDVKTGAILVDYYPFMDPAGKTRSQRNYYRLLKHIDKFIFVTEHLEKLVNREHKDYMIMEGLVNARHETGAARPVGNHCVYAGGLHEIYGVKNLVDAFRESELPYELHLYGNGNLVDYIREAGEQDKRIVYGGIVPHEELLQLEQEAKLLVNPRPVYGKLDTRFNFPSKLMEYMQSGRPVITTRLLGIPAEYHDMMYFFDGDTKEQLREKLEQVLALPEKELHGFGKAVQTFVNENKNNAAVGKKIFDLMNSEG